MRVALTWASVTGYMAACWRALAQRIDLHVVVFEADRESAPFNAQLMEGIPHTLLSREDADVAARVAAAVEDFKPDVVGVCGWATPSFTALLDRPALQSARFISTMDTPWRGDARQRLARYRLAGFLRRIDRLVVPGERAWQYGRRLGLGEDQIVRGLYGIDDALFKPALAARLARPDGWPKRFLYIGRYVDDKAIDVLVKAYGDYRRSVRDPWPLSCCGRGPHVTMLTGVEGIDDHGFKQPDALGPILPEHGVFVLPSRYEPWGLVVVESCAAGLPVICTEACGSHVELVRSAYNGLTVATDNPAALAGAMRWMHEHHDLLPEMGRRSQALADAYGAQVWAERWHVMLRQLTGK